MNSNSMKTLPQGSSRCQISVKLYPELCSAALKAKLAKELALWYELRAINSNGSSRLVLNDAVAALVEDFGYTQSTAYRLLNDGDGKLWEIKDPPLGTHDALCKRRHRPSFWTRYLSEGQVNNSTKTSSSIVKIKSLEWVAGYLGVSGLGCLVKVPASVFRGRGVKNAWLYASFFKPDGFKAKPISRDSLKVATGISRRSQIRYDKVAGNKRVANFAFQADGKGGLYPMLEFRPGKSKQYLTVRRLGNIYHSKAMIAPRGMTKKVNARLRHRSLERDEASCVPKRFFLSAKSFLKCHNKDPESFLLVSPWHRLIQGRLEWCLV